MKKICGNGEFLIRDKYYLYNNLWGAKTGFGTQCIWEMPSGSPRVAWGTSWDWKGPGDSIKSYAAAVFGWHWGWKVPNTGLPIRLSSIRSARTDWRFNLFQKTSGGLNVTYDIWLSDNPQLNNGDPIGEIMIWLYNTGNIRPIGSRKINLMIAETEWELWGGSHPVSGWPVYSFIRTANTDSESLDLVDFFNYLTSQGLSDFNHLLSVEAGVEVFTGCGRLDTKHYFLDIKPITQGAAGDSGGL